MKCLKNYQAEDTILFFVPISYKKRSSDYPPPPNVPFKENIKVFPILDFINAFNFGEDACKILFKFINKAIEAKKTRNKGIILMLKKSVEDFNLLKDGQKIIHDFA